MSTKVTLRQKPISGKRHSLYLDFYPPIIDSKTGKPTRREFLGFFLYDDPQKRTDKLHNKETEQTAEQIQQRRQNEINKPEIYSLQEKEQLRIIEFGEVDFIQYCKNSTINTKGQTKIKWDNTLKYLTAFTGGSLKFSDMNKKTVSDFKEYLLSSKSYRNNDELLGNNSARLYFSAFKSIIKQAYNEEYLQKDIGAPTENIKYTEVNRNFLTLEELNKLVKTECKSPILKKAALFSAMTGLRHSDIFKMVWSEVEFIEGNGYFIKFTQKKTRGNEMMPISEQAYSLLGERRLPTDKVFEGLVYSTYFNSILENWILKAGITKEITFHCFRHTYATLQLSQGTDIYTVSKMLGHRDLKTTALYTKVVDKLKRDATGRINLNFNQ
jgi:integrase